MKRYLFTAFIFAFFFFTPLRRTSANAEIAHGTCAYVPSTSVYFYSDEPDETRRQGLFRLPYTYYVRIVGEEKNYYRVEYLTDGATTKKLVGYCKKNELIPVDYVPDFPYLYLTVPVTYILDGNAKDEGFSELTVACAYYGDYDDGTRVYSYVLRGESFGYVLKPSTLTYELNDEYERRTQSQPPASSTDEPHESAKPARTLLLVVLCLLVPTLAALILRQPGKQPYESEE